MWVWEGRPALRGASRNLLDETILSGLHLNRLAQELGPDDPDLLGGRDSNSDLASLDGEDLDFDVVCNEDGLLCFSAQDEDGYCAPFTRL